MNTQCSPFPELEIEIPRGGYVVRKGLVIASAKWRGRVGLVLFESQHDCLRFAAEVESRAKEASVEPCAKTTIRHRSWDHLCKCIAETRISCIHVALEGGGVRTVFVR